MSAAIKERSEEEGQRPKNNDPNHEQGSNVEGFAGHIRRENSTVKVENAELDKAESKDLHECKFVLDLWNH